MEKMEKEIKINLKAVVIGGSGAVGRELVDYLTNSGNWEIITLIVRRKIERWNSLPMNGTKVNFIILENLDILGKSRDEILKLYPEMNFEGYDSVFNCLGSRVKNGNEEFYKVDFTYVEYSASLCEKFNIPHFSHVTSEGANKNSCFLYMRVKGEIEEKLQSMKIEKLSIFRPGAILDRDNDYRCGESFLKCLVSICCCFISSIQSKELGIAIGYEAEKSKSLKKQKYIYKNSEIVELSSQSLKSKII